MTGIDERPQTRDLCGQIPAAADKCEVHAPNASRASAQPPFCFRNDAMSVTMLSGGTVTDTFVP